MTGMPDVCGVWRLRSFYLKNLETDQRLEPLGDRPNGVIILLPEGRMAAILTPTDQKRGDTDAERAEAYAKLIAYSGHYRLEPPDRFVTTVDIAAFQPWVGTEQARRFKLNGDVLDITSEPTRGPLAGGALVVGVVSWVRERA